jgi:hypothetical protein
MKRYQYCYLDIPLPPSASAQTHPQGGIPSTSMQLQFCNVAFLIAAYYNNCSRDINRWIGYIKKVPTIFSRNLSNIIHPINYQTLARSLSGR